MSTFGTRFAGSHSVSVLLEVVPEEGEPDVSVVFAVNQRWFAQTC